MQRLVAVAAATSALACTKEGSNDTIKADDEKKPKNTIDPTSTPTSTTATDTVSTNPTTTATPTNPGYVVVDPMPAPAKCAGAASTISPSAIWKTAKGTMGVEVRLPKSTSADVVYSHKAPPTASSAKIVGASFTGSEVILTVVPDAGATAAWIYLPLECTAGEEHLNVQLDLSALAGGAPPKAGTPVSVTLYDSY